MPIAFCLSGGVDSSSLVSLAAKELNYDVNTFSIIDSDNRYNELNNILKDTVSDIGCQNHKIYLDPKDNFLEKLENLGSYHDTPVTTISYLVHSLISKKYLKKDLKNCSLWNRGQTKYLLDIMIILIFTFMKMRNEEDFNFYLNDWKKCTQICSNPHLKKYNLYFNNPLFRDHIYLNNMIFSSF